MSSEENDKSLDDLIDEAETILYRIEVCHKIEEIYSRIDSLTKQNIQDILCLCNTLLKTESDTDE